MLRRALASWRSRLDNGNKRARPVVTALEELIVERERLLSDSASPSDPMRGKERGKRA